MNFLKLLVCVFVSSSFGVIVATSSHHASTNVEQRSPRGLSYHHHHHHQHYPALIRARRLTTTASKDHLCNDDNLGLLERGLQEHFLYWFGGSSFGVGQEEASTYMSYNCHCDLQQQQQELVVNCHGLGTSPLDPNNNETIELQDTAIFQKDTNNNNKGYYKLKTTWWGDSYFGNASLPQEIYHYHPTTGQLDSCHGTNCQSCRVCGASASANWTVEMDCRSIGYYFSCHNNYTGGFMNQYDFFQHQDGTSGGSSSLSSSCWSWLLLLLLWVIIILV